MPKSIFTKWWAYIIYVFIALLILGLFLPNQNYNLGLKALDKQDYKEALEYFQKVPKDDKNYLSSLNEIKKISKNLDSISLLNSTNNIEKDKTIIPKNKDTVFSADDLRYLYENDLKKFNLLINKSITIKDRVNSIERNEHHDWYISFITNTKTLILCYFDNYKLIENTKSGSYKTIQGMLKGMTHYNVINIENCKIIEN